MRKNKVIKVCGFVLIYIASFVVVTFLWDMLDGKEPGDYDIKEEALTGLLAALLCLLLKYYEKKKFK